MESGAERKFVTNLLETVEDQRRRLFRCFILFASRFPLSVVQHGCMVICVCWS